MRRLLSLLMLILLAGSQTAFAHCVRETADGIAVPAAHAHQGHPAQHRDDAPRVPSSHHGDSACKMVVTCLTAALPADAIVAAGPEAVLVTSWRLATRSYTSPALGFDPPPPRRWRND